VDGLINTAAQEEFRYRKLSSSPALFSIAVLYEKPGIFHPGHDFSTVEIATAGHPEAGIVSF